MDFPTWYQSTNGPELSKTIFNILGTFLPMVNMMLASKFNLQILPEDLNIWVSLAVFVYFSVQAIVGYVRAKQVLQARVLKLESQLSSAGLPIYK